MNHYISTRTCRGVITGYTGWTMHQKQAAVLIVVIFIVLGVLGVLSAVAIPHADDMVRQYGAEEREMEFLRIQAAVTEMLRRSPDGMLYSVGPTGDLREVQTIDEKPLFLSDFLSGDESDWITTGCRYSFTADGVVLQVTD